MTVLTGKFNTRLSVSLIFMINCWSLAVRFQTEMMSSWNLHDTTQPQISLPTINCSPNKANNKFSQQRDASPLRKRTIHFPPSLFASSFQSNIIDYLILITISRYSLPKVALFHL